MKNVLFVCSLNRVRSLTAETLYKEIPGFSVRSAGTQSNARVPISASLIDWADVIFVMEREHEEKLRKHFDPILKRKQIICLDISSNYEYMEPDLVSELQSALTPYF